MPVFTDQTGRTVTIPHLPQRIISLVPSQTELLFDLGLENEVAGITKFCIHPQHWFQHKTRVGGSKQVNMDVIHSLQPDLIIANKEENVKEQVEELAKQFPVWVSDVNNLEDAFAMIRQVGEITGRPDKASHIVTKIKSAFSQLQNSVNKPSLPAGRLKTIYLIWQNPIMTAGGDTFIHAMLQAAGFCNMFEKKTRYPEITIKQVQKSAPDLLLLSSEPYPFKEKHIAEWKERLTGTTVLLVDGEMFSWYGSRLLQAPAYFVSLQQQLTTINLK